MLTCSPLNLQWSGTGYECSRSCIKSAISREIDIVYQQHCNTIVFALSQSGSKQQQSMYKLL